MHDLYISVIDFQDYVIFQYSFTFTIEKNLFNGECEHYRRESTFN